MTAVVRRERFDRKAIMVGRSLKQVVVVEKRLPVKAACDRDKPIASDGGVVLGPIASEVRSVLRGTEKFPREWWDE